MWQWWQGCCIFIRNCGKLGKKKPFKIKFDRKGKVIDIKKYNPREPEYNPPGVLLHH